MNLKEIRTQKGLSQKEVADQLLCSPAVYSRYERGERQPSIEVLIKLSEIFQVSVDYIIGNQEMLNSTFTKYEVELIRASRNADERARRDALCLLNNHLDLRARKDRR